ncbi:MAG: hypothetical protein R3C14_22705 [Caldilineaceae bacterium]
METITREQQEAMGLTRGRQTFVPAHPRQEHRPLPIHADVSHTLDVAPTSTQHVEVRTSAVDRGKGFLLVTIPLNFAFGVLASVLVAVGAGVPFVSIPTLLVGFIVFVLGWFLAYRDTLQHSAEGVALFEARSKWDIIKAEHDRRWDHYERQIEQEEDGEWKSIN